MTTGSSRKPHRSRRAFLCSGVGALASIAVPGISRAQGRFPQKPIEILVGFAAGGGTDATARTFARFFEREIGGTVIVVNRPGAGGEIALTAIARANADAHLIGMTNMPSLITMPIERQTQFKLDDFHLIANLVADPSAFSVVADSPVRDIADLITRARAQPGAISFGTSGPGTDEHLAMAFFEQETGTSFNHVHYRGAGPMATDLIGRHIDMGGLNVGEAMPHGDRLRILVQGGARRSRFAPGVPTFREAGVPIEMSSERGLIINRGVDSGVAKQIMAATAAVARNPEFVSAIEAQFTELDFLEAGAWGERLRGAETRFKSLWAGRRWMTAQ